MGDGEKALEFEKMREKVILAIEENAWDGRWYRRAYFDDGTPLGSIENQECKIDSIAQSWSVISGGGDPKRAETAMNSLLDHLVLREEGLIKLLTPPFRGEESDPGYISSYVPGVRENGGQYTHAAAWVIIAFAKMGDGDRAWELFRLINPIKHAESQRESFRYKLEPYVIAADVYTAPSHVGRGGWSWYTGSGGWMYRAGLEYILGFKKHADAIVMDPCIPRNWREYAIDYRYMDSDYSIMVYNPHGLSRGNCAIRVDGVSVSGNRFTLVNDGAAHEVTVTIQPMDEIPGDIR
jgi:cellobiose phosphorylase